MGLNFGLSKYDIQMSHMLLNKTFAGYMSTDNKKKPQKRKGTKLVKPKACNLLILFLRRMEKDGEGEIKENPSKQDDVVSRFMIDIQNGTKA